MTIHHHIDLEVPDWGEFDIGPTDRPGYRSLVLADAPLGYWRLGEADGDTALDASGHERHGQYLGPVALAQAGALAYDDDAAIDLPGDAHVQTGLAAADFAGPFTISVWFYLHDAPGSPGGAVGQRLITAYRAAGASRLALGLDGDRLAAAWSTGTGFPQITGPTAIATGAWHHAALTYDQQTVRLYLDGAPEAQLSTTLTPLTHGSIVLGVFWPASPEPRYFAGRVDEAAIFDTPLAAGRISEQFHTGIGR